MVFAAGGVHDAFEWWSMIWIPLAVGLTSVAVAVAAFVASARATRIAEEAERGRAEDQMRALAREDARVLGRWIAVSVSPGVEFHWMTRRIDRSTPDLPEALNGWVARADAESLLMGSTVPGAQALLALTRIDIENRGVDLPEDPETRSDLVSRRDLRMRSRIRNWAADPRGTANALVVELLEANAHLDRYLAQPQKI